MPVGMEIYDSAGILQASADMLSHFCKKTGSGTTVANTAGGNAASMATIALPAGMDKPICAVSCASTMAFAGLFSGNLYFWCAGAIGTAFNYYLYDTLEGVATANFGLELYDAAGNITFSSSYRPIEILGLNPGVTNYAGRTVAAALPAWSNTEVNGPLQCWDGGVAAPWDGVSFCGDLRYQHTINVRGAFIDNGGSRINPASIQYENVQISAGSSSSYTYPATVAHLQMLMAVDVTGIPIGSTFF